jgi:hypothetical protein
MWFGFFYALAYLFWAMIYFAWRGRWIYDFLDWSQPVKSLPAHHWHHILHLASHPTFSP